MGRKRKVIAVTVVAAVLGGGAGLAEWRLRSASSEARALGCLDGSRPASAGFSATIEELELLGRIPGLRGRAQAAVADTTVRCLMAFRLFCDDARFDARGEARGLLRAERDSRTRIDATPEERRAAVAWYDAQEDALDWRPHLPPDIASRCAEWTATVEVLRRSEIAPACPACDSSGAGTP